MKLWLDDIREAPTGWVWIKMAEYAIPFIDKNWSKLTHVSLDHDLGEGVATGYEVVKWLEEQVWFGRTPPFTTTVHSDNPVGIKNMLAGIHSIVKLKEQNEKGGCGFKSRLAG